MHTGPLKKLARGDHLVENVSAYEEILAAIELTRTWRASRVGDRIAKILYNSQHVSDDRALAAA